MKSTVFLIAAALAHFDIRQPTPRVQDLDGINDVPCGASPQGSRQVFPIVGGVITGQGYHGKSTMFYKLSLAQTPSTNQDFSIEIHPSTYAERSGPFRIGPLDLSRVAGVRNGVVGTIQVSTEDSHAFSYQCIDVVFQGVEPVPSVVPPVVPGGNPNGNPVVTSPNGRPTAGATTATATASGTTAATTTALVTSTLTTTATSTTATAQPTSGATMNSVSAALLLLSLL
jgi:hypothetical protein